MSGEQGEEVNYYTLSIRGGELSDHQQRLIAELTKAMLTGSEVTLGPAEGSTPLPTPPTIETDSMPENRFISQESLASYLSDIAAKNNKTLQPSVTITIWGVLKETSKLEPAEDNNPPQVEITSVNGEDWVDLGTVYNRLRATNMDPGAWKINNPRMWETRP